MIPVFTLVIVVLSLLHLPAQTILFKPTQSVNWHLTARGISTPLLVTRHLTFNAALRMIRHAVLTSSLPLRTTEALTSCFILVWNHQQSISFSPELRREPETSDGESNALNATLARLILGSPCNQSG